MEAGTVEEIHNQHAVRPSYERRIYNILEILLILGLGASINIFLKLSNVC